MDDATSARIADEIGFISNSLYDINESLKELTSAVSGIGKPMGSPVCKNVSVVTKILPAKLSEEGVNSDEQ